MSAKWQSRTKNTPRYAAWAASDAAQSILQHRASPRRAGSPHSGAMPPARQHCRLVFCFPWAHAYIHTHTHSRKPAVRNKAGEAIVQAPNPPQSLSSHAREDICSRFHLESGHAEMVATAA